MALPKKRRLNRDLMQKALKQGKIVRGRSMSLKYLAVPGCFSAFALIVSRKAAGKAVGRNKLKRRGRAIISKILPGIKEGNLILIFFEQGSAEMKFHEMEQEFLYLFRGAGLLPRD